MPGLFEPSRPGLLDLDLQVDIDLSDTSAGARDYTAPGTFSERTSRRGSRRPDLAFDAPDSDSPALPSRH